VLLELGRLIWAAINLEDVVYPVCRAVRPRHGPFDDFPISSRIDEALNDLRDERPEDELRRRANAWLAEARLALEERNQVVHSTPATWVWISTSPDAEPNDDHDDGEVTLMHLPRNKNRPPVNTPLTTDGLQQTRLRLESARDGWGELTTELWVNRLGLY
jgi:hypothetical protein